MHFPTLTNVSVLCFLVLSLTLFLCTLEVFSALSIIFLLYTSMFSHKHSLLIHLMLSNSLCHGKRISEVNMKTSMVSSFRDGWTDKDGRLPLATHWFPSVIWWDFLFLHRFFGQISDCELAYCSYLAVIGERDGNLINTGLLRSSVDMSVVAFMGRCL